MRNISLKRLVMLGIILSFPFFCASASESSFDKKQPLDIANRYSFLIKDSPKEVIDQVWQIIFRDYMDSNGIYNPDEWIKLRVELLSKSYSDSFDSYETIRGMLSGLEDPYTRFLDPSEFKEMRIETSGELSGVGIQISLDKISNELVVVSPIEGTPAARAGLMPKDKIVSIDGLTTLDMPIEKAVKLIRGKPGTKVVLEIDRDGRKFQVKLMRDRIEIVTVNTRINTTKDGFKIGYIRLKQFNANASKEMRMAINRLQASKVNGYVLDLRSNPGGLLESSIAIARQWLNKGTIVSTKTRNGIRDIRKANGTALTSLPVVVLVNEGSASASEILSGAIQDNRRGKLVGQKTFGKGLVQSVRRLSDGSGLTVTIAKYLTPNGTDIHKNGIIPDHLVKMTNKELVSLTVDDLGGLNDSQYQAAQSILLRSLINKDKTMFIPGTLNLKYALAY